VTSEAAASRYRLIRDGGDWIEVESVARTSQRTRYCQMTNDYFKTLAIRVFVARADLVSVLTRPVTAEFADGTRVELDAGAPVSALLPESARDGRARRTVFADGLLLTMVVPDDAVGLVYAAPEERAVPGTTTDSLNNEVEITFDGRASKQGGTYVDALGLDGGYRHRIYGQRDVDGATLVDLEGSCGRYRARVARSAVVPANQNPMESFDFEEGRSPRTYWIAKGTAISWADGSPAGVARDDGWREDLGEPSGTRRCFRFMFNPDAPPDTPEASLLLCAEETALSPAPSRRSDADVARIGTATRHYIRLELDSEGLVDASLLATLRATAKDELILGYGATVAIALPGETAAQAKKKVPPGVTRWVVRARITENDSVRTERRSELLDETVSPPRMVQQRTASVSLNMPENSYRRALFKGTFVGILGSGEGARPR
jgi:hypothetical protein